LKKPKTYDWKDSNLALFGSQLEKDVKKESAMGEPAWKGAGEKVGLQVWRVVQFKITHWPKEDYGKFYSGDSYIILNTYEEEGGSELLHDVHFWIGKESTQDEYGTAAYKTVELDNFLDGLPVQHREVQGHESQMFLSYFKTITIMKGGAATGFRHVGPREYTPRLLHFCGTRKSVQVNEVPLCRSRIKSDDVFILDLGEKIYQWNGEGSNKDERYKAMTFCQELEHERCGRAKADVIEEGRTSEEHEFYTSLTGEDEEDDGDQYDAKDKDHELFRLSDASGKMKFNQSKKGQVSKSDFDSKDVFIFDCKNELFVWIGDKTTKAEKNNAMAYAHEYLMKTDHALIPVSCMKEGKESKEFRVAIAA